MYTVVVVDDETTALNHICTIINMKCKNYQVIGTADNGISGLEEVKQKRPDVLISDVKMPLLNGIELTALVKKELPDCMSIIVSGYQDFEYMKGALHSEVCDYLFKPITPNNLKTVLDKVMQKLNGIYYLRRNKLIQKLCKGIETNQETIKKYFSNGRYYVALARKNGLPKRFSSGANIEIFSDINEQMFIYGRDEMEALYIMPEAILFKKSFQQIVQDMVKKEENEQQYLTIVLLRASIDVQELPDMIKKLYRALDMRSVVGVNQMLFLDDLEVNEVPIKGEDNKEEILHKLAYFIKEGQHEKFRAEIKRLFLIWQKQKRPQLWVENMARQILYIIQKYHADLCLDNSSEFMLDDAFFYATSLDELLENLYFIFNKNLIQEGSNIGKVDTPEFLEIIKLYLQKNIAGPITLQSVCKKFAVSQTHLSKVFRKYEDTSFNNYLTDIRIEKAKQIMKQDKNIFVKDIAQMVGYNDQFYFSRIFRAITGLCPSDYIESL